MMENVANRVAQIDLSIPNGDGDEWLTAAIATQITQNSTSMNYIAVKLAEWELRRRGKNVQHIFCNKAISDCHRKMKCIECREKERALNRDRIAIMPNAQPDYHYDYDLDKLISPTLIQRMEGKQNSLMRQRLIDATKLVICWMEEYLRDHDVKGAVLFNGLYYPESALAEVLRRHGVQTYFEEQMVGTGRISFVKDGLALIPPDHPVKISKRVVEWTEKYPLEKKRDYVLVLFGYPWDSLRLIDKSFFRDEMQWREEVCRMEKELNIPFVYSHHPITKPKPATNSFELARRAKFVLAYASSSGLEAAAMGLPVVIASNVHYKDIVYYPHDLEEWRGMVRDGARGKLKPNKDAALERLTWFREVQCWDIYKYFADEVKPCISRFDEAILDADELHNAVDCMLAGKAVEF